jgi:hypothetical protein
LPQAPFTSEEEGPGWAEPVCLPVLGQVRMNL